MGGGDIQPEYLFIGHGHYDHAQEVPRILNRSRRTVIVGTPEHCDQIRAALAGKLVPRCKLTVPKKGVPFGTRGRLDNLIPGVKISVVTVPHSAADTPDPLNPKGPYCPSRSSRRTGPGWRTRPRRSARRTARSTTA